MIKNCTGCCSRFSKKQELPTDLPPVALSVNKMVMTRAVFGALSLLGSLAGTFFIGPVALLGLIPVACVEIFFRIYTQSQQQSSNASPTFSSSIVIDTAPFIPGQPVGLKNSGTSCWMNAGLQLLNQALPSHPRLREVACLNQFSIDYQRARSHFEKVANIDTQPMRQYLSTQSTGISNSYVQEDAIVLFDSLLGNERKASYNLTHYLQEYPTNDVLGSLVALDIPRQGTIPSFRGLTENFFDYRDDLQREHQIRFDCVPQGIFLQCKRFYQDERTQEKINHLLDIPPCLGLPGRLISQDQSQEERLTYTCNGFIVHSGSLHGGHYVAYIKQDHTWWYCSDTTVYPVGDVSREMKSAYILHYAKD